MKRRQVNNQTKITQAFPAQKNTEAVQALVALKKGIESENRGLNFKTQQLGDKDCSTPYRSVSRINSLLRPTTFEAQYGQSKLVATTNQSTILDKLNAQSSSDFSKPSSTTTACTRASTLYDYSPSNKKVKAEKKRDKKVKNQIEEFSQVGKKRCAQQKLDQMELFTRIQYKNKRLISQILKLIDKKTGNAYQFPLYEQKQLKGYGNHPIVQGFDMSKLEVEYDYDTDNEQIQFSKSMLLRDLVDAIRFFCEDDPIKLVDNLML